MKKRWFGKLCNHENCKCETYLSPETCNSPPTHFYIWQFYDEPVEIVCRCEKHKSSTLEEISYEEVLVLEVMES